MDRHENNLNTGFQSPITLRGWSSIAT